MNKEAIEAIAAKLQVPVEVFWGTLVKQAPIFGITNLLLIIAWLIFSVTCFVFCSKIARKADSEICGSEVYGIWAVIFGVLGTALTLTCLYYLSDHLSLVLASFFNPEYWALKQIIH